MWLCVFFFRQNCNTTFWVFVFFFFFFSFALRSSLSYTRLRSQKMKRKKIKGELTDMHALMLKKKIAVVINVSHYSYLKNKTKQKKNDWMESKTREVQMRAGPGGKIGVRLVSSHGVRGSKVRTAGRPTGSLRAAGGAPPRASPRPWCRPGRILGPRPAWGRSCSMDVIQLLFDTVCA